MIAPAPILALVACRLPPPPQAMETGIETVAPPPAVDTATCPTMPTAPSGTTGATADTAGDTGDSGTDTAVPFYPRDTGYDTGCFILHGPKPPPADTGGPETRLVGTYDPAELASAVLLGEGTASGFEKAGIAVAGIGDVNSDGFDDVAVVGWNQIYIPGGAGPGVVYFAMGPFGPQLDLGGPNGVYYEEENPTGVVPLGDVDGDGSTDLAIVGPGNLASGIVPVLEGATLSGAAPTRLFSLGVGGAYYGYYGMSVAGGDTDGDGISEIGVTSTNLSVGLVRQGHVGDADVLTLPNRIESTIGAPQDITMGDMDGDGLADLAFVLSGINVQGWFGQGEALVYSGDTLHGVLTEAEATTNMEVPADLFTPEGIVHGDFDGDGNQDLALSTFLIPTPYSGPHAELYFVYGPLRHCMPTILDPTLGSVHITGEFFYLGGDGADLDGDGADDLLSNGSALGPADVLYGPVIGAAEIDDVPYLRLWDSVVGDAGPAAFVGDVDADARPDILVGKPLDDTNGPHAGAAYLLLGGSIP